MEEIPLKLRKRIQNLLDKHGIESPGDEKWVKIALESTDNTEATLKWLDSLCKRKGRKFEIKTNNRKTFD